MAKKQKPQTEVVEQLVLVHDPILGSRYELQSVEVESEEFFQHLGIDASAELERLLTEELKKEANE